MAGCGIFILFRSDNFDAISVPEPSFHSHFSLPRRKCTPQNYAATFQGVEDSAPVHRHAGAPFSQRLCYRRETPHKPVSINNSGTALCFKEGRHHQPGTCRKKYALGEVLCRGIFVATVSF